MDVEQVAEAAAPQLDHDGPAGVDGLQCGSRREILFQQEDEIHRGIARLGRQG
jgi:hypothetical protein